jgi:hypothetical protein
MSQDHAYKATHKESRASLAEIAKRQRRYYDQLNHAKRLHPSNKPDGRKHLRVVVVRR